LLKLTVKVGPKLEVGWLALGISDTVLRLLEDSAKGGYAARISKRLKDAAKNPGAAEDYL